MNIEQITAKSKKRAEEIAKRDGGVLVPVYAVVKLDGSGNVQSITHDKLNDLYKIHTEDAVRCFLCNDKFNRWEGSSYRLDSSQKESSGIVCADCAYNPDEKLARYNQEHVQGGERIFSFVHKSEVVVEHIDEYGVFPKKIYGGVFPTKVVKSGKRNSLSPRIDFKDFVILDKKCPHDTCETIPVPGTDESYTVCHECEQEI